jgi:hypothetical protein
VATVASQDDTEVTVEVGKEGVTLAGNGYPALNGAVNGQGQYTVTLDALEVLVVAASPIHPTTYLADNDLTGSLVHSCSGSRFTVEFVSGYFRDLRGGAREVWS